jgi:hypothetical protein
VGKCEGNDRAKSNCGAAEAGSRNTEIEHRIPLFDCFERPECAFSALSLRQPLAGNGFGTVASGA